MITLLDNTVLTNFALIDSLDLLQKALGEKAATVRQVYDEYQKGVLLSRVPQCNWEWLSILDLTSAERQIYEGICVNLDSGEAACIAVAISRKYRILTDDRAGRKMAMQKGCPISGTLGILLRLVDLEFIELNQADILLNQMIEAGYRSPVSSLIELK